MMKYCFSQYILSTWQDGWNGVFTNKLIPSSRSWEIVSLPTCSSGRMKVSCVVPTSGIHIWPIYLSWRKILNLSVSSVSVFWQLSIDISDVLSMSGRMDFSAFIQNPLGPPQCLAEESPWMSPMKLQRKVNAVFWSPLSSCNLQLTLWKVLTDPTRGIMLTWQLIPGTDWMSDLKGRESLKVDTQDRNPIWFSWHCRL